MKYILVDNNGYILSVADKQLSPDYIQVEKLPEPYKIYKYINGGFIEDELLKKEYEQFQKDRLKKRASKKVKRYIEDLLLFLDYDGLADLLICEEIPMYKKEVKKIKQWIKKVYEKYEEICKDIDNNKQVDIDNIENILPKYQ
jgi:hypothetical protein